MADGPNGFGRPKRHLPEVRVDRWLRPVAQFMRVEASAGVMLLACAVLALVLANSEYAEAFHHLLQTPIGVSIGDHSLSFPLEGWINDGLMTIFFFVVGLEIKREFLFGSLRDPKQAALPLAAALGGMLVPAAIYLSLQAGEPGERGWGIPMATDIAFVVGVLSLLGKRVPHTLRILMLTLAIADDIGAVLVIAIGYTESIDLLALLAGGIGFAGCIAINWAGVRNVWIYVAMAAFTWYAFHASGVHSTVAGVILGMLTPSTPWLEKGVFARTINDVDDLIEGDGWLDPEHRNGVLLRMAYTARESVPPLERIEAALHPWVSFGIMPLFALANAGVSLRLDSLAHPVSIAVAAGLVIGKPIGILLTSWVFVRLGIARLPSDLSWPMIAAGGFLGGIGFTMALFIAGLALGESLLDPAKVGILVGSLVSAIIGAAMLLRILPKAAEAAPELSEEIS